MAVTGTTPMDTLQVVAQRMGFSILWHQVATVSWFMSWRDIFVSLPTGSSNVFVLPPL